MLACRLLGHRPRFWADSELMRWECERGCGLAGEKRYATAADARRYAGALDRRDADSLGERPTLSLVPLWLGRRAARRPPNAS